MLMSSDMHAELVAELKQAGFDMIETHISRVFLRGTDVYKIKRPVSLGFLDFSTLAQREQACLAEVELNRRLAPDVYLGVVGVLGDDAGGVHFVPRERCAAQPVREWAVHMRRLRDQDRADVLLTRGALTVEDLERLAECIATFHCRARADAHTAKLGGRDALLQNVTENFSQLEQLTDGLDEGERCALRAYQRGFLQREQVLLEARARGGFVRDGHGDLRLEHCYRQPDGSFIVIDCIEFNDRFRYADVCADLSFLTMDLRHHGRADLAELFVASYARVSHDYPLYGLLDFYESYRATVRGKVSAMLAQDPLVEADTRERAAKEARRYLLQAIAAGARPLGVPTLWVTFGAIASGKSTLARALAEKLGLAVLSADYTRKELLGVHPELARHEAPFAGAYSAGMTDSVYDTLLARAGLLLASGRSVVLDATFRARAHRQRARDLARQHGAELRFVECRVARSVALARLATRSLAPSVSDGRGEIYDAFVASYEPPDELPSSELLQVDGEQPAARILTGVLARAS
jgi:uncharacterized protein